MSGSDYEVFEDPYCYKGAFVLRNKAGLGEAKALQAFELEMSTLRAEEALPRGRFGPSHYRAIHRHLFGDVYARSTQSAAVMVVHRGRLGARSRRRGAPAAGGCLKWAPLRQPLPLKGRAR